MEVTRQLDTTTRLSDRASARLTEALIACGAAVGPFFYAVVAAQILTRPGFDIRRHAISLLSLGDMGWIQILNFAVTGLLAIACAVGARRHLRGGRAATWGPVLIGLFGVGAGIAAIFHPDPGLGFPPGAPAGMPTTMTWHATIHNLAFMLAFVALVAACFVFARRFASIGLRGWTAYSVASGVGAPLFIAAGIATPSLVGALIACAGLIGFGWLSTLAVRLSTEVRAT